MLRADGAEVQKNRRSAGSAVEREGNGTVLAGDDVGSEDDLAGFLAVHVVDGKRAHGHLVRQRLAVELHALVDMRIDSWERRFLVSWLIFTRIDLRRQRNRLRIGAEDGKGQEQHGEHGNRTHIITITYRSGTRPEYVCGILDVWKSSSAGAGL